MRYKFRGKRVDNGEWVYGDLMTGKNPSITWWKPTSNDSYEIDCADVDPLTVGQYTGLQDKNGKEIYEGDILEGYDGIDGYLGCKHVIQYFQPDCRYISIFAHEFASGKWDETNESVRLVWVECEVIGTRWDNPELLGG